MSDVVVLFCPHCRAQQRKILFVNDNVCGRCGKLFRADDLECVLPAQMAVFRPKKPAKGLAPYGTRLEGEKGGL